MTATPLAANQRLSPILKWAGGKEQELKYIIPNLPNSFKGYYEPFVGGGSVYSAITAEHYYINDRSEELIDLYRNVAKPNNILFIKSLDEIVHNWDILTRVVAINADFFIDLYRSYADNKTNEQTLKNCLYEFILRHAGHFNGMF
jgi:DNA adenine methylase